MLRKVRERKKTYFYSTISPPPGSKHDAATSFVEAANCFKKTDHKEASESLLKAIDIYTDMGR